MFYQSKSTSNTENTAIRCRDGFLSGLAQLPDPDLKSKCVRGFLMLLCSLILTTPAVVSAQSPGAPNPPCLLDDSGQCDSTDRVSTNGAMKKWHPGHYMQLKGNDEMDVQANRFKLYDQIANNKDLEGVVWKVSWGLLEGDTRGDYKAGFAMIHEELDKLESLPVPKRFVLRFESISYKGDCPEGFPKYLQENGWLLQTKSCLFKMWNRDAVDAWIDLLEAYAAEFDDEPYLEAVYLIKESSIGWGGVAPVAEFDQTAYWRNLRRIMAAGGAAFVKTNAVMSLNHAPDQETMNGAMQYAADSGLGHGEPDTIPKSCYKNLSWPMKGDVAYTGFKEHGGVRDFRGYMPSLRSAEVSEMGLNLGDCYPAELFDHVNNFIRASHMFWSHNTYAGTEGQQWPAILRFIETHPLTNTNCPRMYTQGCNRD